MDYRAIQKDLHDTGNMHNISIDKLRMFYFNCRRNIFLSCVLKIASAEEKAFFYPIVEYLLIFECVPFMLNYPVLTKQIYFLDGVNLI